MSASTEKKLRALARAEGTDKKTLQAEEEAKKTAKTHRRYVIAIVAAVLFIAVTLFLNSPFLYRGTTAVTVGGEKFSPAEVNYEYATDYYSFVNSYGSYASLFGLDTSDGVQGLGSQECTILDEEGGTWRDYFKEEALATLQQTVGLCKYAEEYGIALSEEDLADIEASFDTLDETAETYGYANGDKFLSGSYGQGVNVSVVKTMLEKMSLASVAYNKMLEDAEAADTDFEDYDMINIRHILVKAEADEDGNYTDEAIAAAKEKAEAILAEFEAGEKTEEAFSELANEKSEDTGSNTNGGLYENVYKDEMVEEFNDWCFDSSRKVGDTGIVHGSSSSYDGYHVMYFSGYGDKYSTSSARTNELAAMIDDDVVSMSEAQEVKTTIFYNLIGK